MRFPLRIPDDKAGLALWRQFTAKADEAGLSLNTTLLLLVRAFVDGRISIGARRT